MKTFWKYLYLALFIVNLIDLVLFIAGIYKPTQLSIGVDMALVCVLWLENFIRKINE